VAFMPTGATILFVSSIGGFNPTPPLGIYGVSKTALFGLTKLLARELGAKGIRVNCLSPGLIKTRFSSMLWESEEASKVGSSNTFLNRLGDPSEMAAVAAFLVSDDASYITGENIVAGGGMLSHL